MASIKRNLLWTAGLMTAGYFLNNWVKKTLRRFDYKNKVILITGGSRGLGLVLARELARRGAHLALLARDQAELDNAKNDILRLYPECEVHLVPCDVKDASQITWAIKKVLIHFGTLDMLINNAGIITVMPYENAEEKDFKESMDTHFWAPFHMTEAVLPHFKTNGGGRIVNISSIGGKIAVPHLAPYSASKFALVGYSDAIQAELAKDKIYVTTVCPGLMRTGSIGHAEMKGQESLEYSWFAIASSLPFLSVAAENAARQICDAAAHGQAELVISLPAKIAVKLRALAPEIFSDLTQIASRLLPNATEQTRSAKLGMNSHSFVAPSIVTKAAEKAAERNNEGRI